MIKYSRCSQMPPQAATFPQKLPDALRCSQGRMQSAGRKFLRLQDSKGFISECSRKADHPEKVVAKRLQGEVKTGHNVQVGQHVAIKQKTKKTSGTILKVNLARALVEVGTRKIHVPPGLLDVATKDTPNAAPPPTTACL